MKTLKLKENKVCPPPLKLGVQGGDDKVENQTLTCKVKVQVANELSY